jgi:hypothetical protein
VLFVALTEPKIVPDCDVWLSNPKLTPIQVSQLIKIIQQGAATFCDSGTKLHNCVAKPVNQVRATLPEDCSGRVADDHSHCLCGQGYSLSEACEPFLLPLPRLGNADDMKHKQ